MSTEDGAMILDLAGGRFFGLNPTAAIMWRRLTDGIPPEEVAMELADDLSMVEERLLSDVHALVAVLRRHGLLVGGEPPS